MKKLLLISAAALAAVSASAQFDANTEYYIRNVETGQYLTNGHSWGTLGVTRDFGRAFNFVEKDGGYMMKSPLGVAKFENGELYIDGNEGDNVVMNFEKQEDGTYLISNGGVYLKNNEAIEYGNRDNWMYMGYMGDGTIHSVNFASLEEASKWEFLTKTDLEARMEGATEANPAEATFYLKAHNIEWHDPENTTAWVWTKSGEQASPALPEKNWQGWDDQGTWWCNQSTYLWCINEYEAEHEQDEQTIPEYVPTAGTDVLSQEVMMAKIGYYEATYRIVNQSNTELKVKFNDTEVKAYEDTEEDLWYAGAYESLHKNPMKAIFHVGVDRMLNIRMEKTIDPEGQNRFAFKSVRLKYLGREEPAAVAVNFDENAPVEYFNLQGVRVTNPENGIFVKKQGNKVTKVVK